MTWGEVQFSYWINILFLKAPSNATREQSGEDDCGHIREGDGGKGIVVQLWQREHGPLAERDKHLGEVEEEEHDGDGDAQNAPAQDHVHRQIIFRPVTKARHNQENLKLIVCTALRFHKVQEYDPCLSS